MKSHIFALVTILLMGLSQSNASPCEGLSQGKLGGDNLLVLINKDQANQLRANWEPRDLISLPRQLTEGAQELRKEAAQAYTEMATKAGAEGIHFYIHSSYRSYYDQCSVFKDKISKWTQFAQAAVTAYKKTGEIDESYRKQFDAEMINQIQNGDAKAVGLKLAQIQSAEPGRSQHQLGTAVDLVFDSVRNSAGKRTFAHAMKNQREFRWLTSNAHKFGFVLSYPEPSDESADEAAANTTRYNGATGYIYEPWHWRYVGAETAAKVVESGLPLDLYLARRR